MSLKPAFRSLRKEPVTTAIVVVVLALGIGANTAIFSVIDAVLLRALPFPQSERMMMVLTRFLPSGRLGNTSAADFNDWRQQSTSFEALAIYSGAPSPVSE